MLVGVVKNGSKVCSFQSILPSAAVQQSFFSSCQTFPELYSCPFIFEALTQCVHFRVYISQLTMQGYIHRGDLNSIPTRWSRFCPPWLRPWLWSCFTLVLKSILPCDSLRQCENNNSNSPGRAFCYSISTIYCTYLHNHVITYSGERSREIWMLTWNTLCLRIKK